MAGSPRAGDAGRTPTHHLAEPGVNDVAVDIIDVGSRAPHPARSLHREPPARREDLALGPAGPQNRRCEFARSLSS